MPRYEQGKYWLLTIPHHGYVPFLHSEVAYIRGQVEEGGSTGYLHWQLLVCFKKKLRLRAVKRLFGDEAHCELSRSECANEYVWKEETRVDGTQFELGKRPLKRNDPTDWEQVWESCKKGKVEEIPADIRVRCYQTIRRIEKDYLKPESIQREVIVLWGRTGVGKSKRAWEEAGLEAYPKDPCTKFWDGYSGQENVIIDEFRGSIGISHVLRWFDRYPVIVEVKGGATVLRAKRIWITSNLEPGGWYPDLDVATREALERRLTVIEVK